MPQITAAGFTVVGFVARPWGDEPKYERVSQYLERHLRKTDRVFVWGHEPEIYWASGALPSASQISNAAVFCPWRRNGFTEFTSVTG